MEMQSSKSEKRRGFFKGAAIAALIGGIAAGVGPVRRGRTSAIP